ncbi:enoyl-CoA hydratase-related protein [Micromonospora sp. NPDC018662]|uniref:enoyl-CoA hydratase-related protein n=1 Tax=Micromonospora sp. NPDC018662 TaxID=3364238 RepID=UPI0037AD1CC3
MSADVLVASLTTPDGRYTLDPDGVERLHDTLTEAERRPGPRILGLTGSPGTFCTGMDLPGAAGGHGDARRFQDLLDRVARSPVVVVALVDGTVAGGGVGLAAASDFVYATARSTFALPELRLGLLPYMVVPYLVRRVGFQQAYAMALSTQPVLAAEAHRAGLVDAVADDPARLLARLAVRLGGVRPAMVRALKEYFETVSVVDERVRAAAPAALERRLADPQVRVTLGRATRSATPAAAEG